MSFVHSMGPTVIRGIAVANSAKGHKGSESIRLHIVKISTHCNALLGLTSMCTRKNSAYCKNSLFYTVGIKY